MFFWQYYTLSKRWATSINTGIGDSEKMSWLLHKRWYVLIFVMLLAQNPYSHPQSSRIIMNSSKQPILLHPSVRKILK